MFPKISTSGVFHCRATTIGYSRGLIGSMKILLLVALCAIAPLSTPAFAQDGDPLRGKITELEGRARAAKEQGRPEELRDLMEQLHRLHLEMDGREVQRRIEELQKAGKHEEAEQLAHRVQEARGDAERRQHAAEAIKHLHAAGLHEQAAQIEQILRAHDQEQMQRAMGEMHEQMAKMARTIEELREQVSKLRGESAPRKE